MTNLWYKQPCVAQESSPAWLSSSLKGTVPSLAAWMATTSKQLADRRSISHSLVHSIMKEKAEREAKTKAFERGTAERI